MTIALPAHVTASAVSSGVERFLDRLNPARGEPARRELVEPAEPAIQTVVVDARALTRMDGAALRFLVALKTHCETARLHFQLVNPSPDIHPFLQLFRLAN
ncbi:MAG: STAS domain-containing protein [Lentisphaerae bacterium]|nr:STAS domain-containing protein [Lentisphaerota bacterium]